MNMRGLLLLFTIAILGACSPYIFRKPIYSTTTYKGERGSKKVTKRNQAKADRERDMVEALETAEESRETLIAQKKAAAASDSLNQEKLLDAKIAQLLLKTEQIITELNTVSPYSSKGHEKALKLSTELNDLIYNQINPLSQVISSSKEIVRLGSEITFETGSATLTADGKQKISLVVSNIEKDILAWNGYLNHHNEQIFKEGDFRSVIVIYGYADTQGSKNEEERKQLNLKLSQERAESVAKQFEAQLKKIRETYKIDILFEVNSKGEDTPPNYVPNKKLSDESRRICLINLVVGPKILLLNE